MIIKNVPFFANPDETHCYQAVIKMILKYLLPDQDFSWSQLDQLSGKKEGLWTWPQRARINLKKMGFEVVAMSAFDYESFINEGSNYLYRKYGEEVANAQVLNSDIDREVETSKEYLNQKIHSIKLPTIAVIKKYLNNGYLVACNVNAKALSKQIGYVGHYVLIAGYDRNNFYMYDPGPPAMKNKKVSLDLFKKAWEYPDKKGAGFEAYKFSSLNPEIQSKSSPRRVSPMSRLRFLMIRGVVWQILYLPVCV